MLQPRVLDDYTLGRAILAIQEVAVGHKPIAEIMTMRERKSDIEYDLRACIRECCSRNGRKVRYWILPTRDDPTRFRFGFYREPWTFAALKFLDEADLPAFDRDWIQGLLFGYRPDAIQKFLDAQRRKAR